MGDGCPTPRPGRFAPEKEAVSTVHEAGWAPVPVWSVWTSCVSNQDIVNKVLIFLSGAYFLQYSW